VTPLDAHHKFVGDTAVVRTTGLSKSYRGVPALADVNLHIEDGEIFGYLGPNGAGKTTTLRLLMGLLRPTSGSATVLGIDAWRGSVQVHRRVGYVSGEAALYDRLTARQHFEYFCHLRRTDARVDALKLAARLELDPDRPVRTLSKGNRQKVALVLALICRDRGCWFSTSPPAVSTRSSSRSSMLCCGSTQRVVAAFCCPPTRSARSSGWPTGSG
jgi:ABC-2 type transport system ATP-binding protein